MRSQILLDKELEKLAGTDRRRVDLKEASDQSDWDMRMKRIDSIAESLFEQLPGARDRFIRKGLEWYKRKEQKTIPLPSEMEFK